MGEAKAKSKLPPLRDWLAKMIDSNDAAARDEFASFADWITRMLDHPGVADRRQAMILRMTQASSLAIIETCNYEQSKGAETAEVMELMCRCLGLSFGYALMSLSWADDAPIRSITKPLTSEFELGMKFAIDECLRREAEERTELSFAKDNADA